MAPKEPPEPVDRLPKSSQPAKSTQSSTQPSPRRGLPLPADWAERLDKQFRKNALAEIETP